MPNDDVTSDNPTTPAPTTPTGSPEPAPPQQLVDVRQTPEFKAALNAALKEKLPQEVERVFSDRLPRERTKIRKQLKQEFQASMSPDDDEPAPAPGGGELAEMKAQLESLQSQLALSSAFNDFPSFSSTQRDWIAKNLPRGADPREYCEQVASVMGIGKQEPATQPPTEPEPQASPGVTLPPQPATPTGRPASDMGGPSNGSETFSRTDPRRWNDNDIERLKAEAKEQKVNPARYVKDSFLDALRGHRVIIGGGRPK